MIYTLNYIIYIIYSFLIIGFLYMCLELYKKYSYKIFNNKEIITSEKYSNKKYNPYLSNTTNKIKKVKKLYKIKSTEKTYDDIKFISSKPNYINLNNKSIDNFDIHNIKNYDKIKKNQDDHIIHKISIVYLKTKQEFYNLFVNSENNKYFINNINDFELFHKNNFLPLYNSNILIKFYNNDSEHIYIYVNENKMTKIIYNDKYDNISNMIEKNNGIFMLEDENNNNIICYGSYIQDTIKPHSIKNIFFNNFSNCETNKNYILLSKFKFIKIYFFISNEINY